MHKSVVIVAGGYGRRMGSVIPKQFLELRGKPVLMRTIQCFIEYDKNIEVILVLPKDQVTYWDRLCFIYDFQYIHKIAFGGETRFASVCNGFKYVTKDAVTGIHDGVRPLVNIQTIRTCFEEADIYGSAIPCVDITESVREIDNKGSRSVSRDKLRIVQTPQVFRYEILEAAFRQEYSTEFTDDAAVVEKAGFPIHLVEGNRENVKITTPVDLKLAEYLLQTADLRTPSLS